MSRVSSLSQTQRRLGFFVWLWRKKRNGKIKISLFLWISTFFSITGFLAPMVLLLLRFNNCSKYRKGVGSVSWSLVWVITTTSWSSLHSQEVWRAFWELSVTSQLFPFSFCMKLRPSMFSLDDISHHATDANMTVRAFTQNAENKVHRWSRPDRMRVQICFSLVLCEYPFH